MTDTLGRLIREQAAAIGDRVAFTFEGRDVTYAELDAAASQVAQGLIAEGVHAGDRVAFLDKNSLECFELMFGAAKIGAVLCPINWRLAPPEAAHIVNDAQARVLVVGTEFLPMLDKIEADLTSVRRILVLGAHPRHQDYTAWRDAQTADDPVVEVGADDVALQFYTSGTTGPSKGVISPHAQGLNIGRYCVQQYGYRSDDVLYVCLPLFHVNALWYSCNAALWADGAIALAPRFSASQFWEDIVRTGATQFNALGVMASLLLKQPPSEAERHHKVRQSMVVPLSKQAFKDYAERFRLKVTSLFAATETFAVTIYKPDEPTEKAASAGHPHGLSEVAIVDDDDQALPCGSVGEILVRPREPWIGMLGYYKMPEATLQANRNLWFHTGDRGFLDADGYLWFVDRKKESIRRRGENISAYEVEMLIAKHADVREVAAIAVASDVSEDDVMVYVVPQQGATLTEAELIDFCSRNMSYFMVPRYIAFIDELPKTASEKIEKYKLKQMAERDLAKLWDREKAGIKIKR